MRVASTEARDRFRIETRRDDGRPLLALAVEHSFFSQTSAPFQSRLQTVERGIMIGSGRLLSKGLLLPAACCPDALLSGPVSSYRERASRWCPLASGSAGAIVTPGAVLRRRPPYLFPRDSSLSLSLSLSLSGSVGSLRRRRAPPLLPPPPPPATVSTTQLMMKFLAFNRSTGRNYPHKAERGSRRGERRAREQPVV